MSLLLEPTKLAAAAGKGKRNKTDDGWLWRPLKLEDSDENRKAGLYPPFEHVYAPYQSEKDLLYRHHNGSKGLLTSAARIKLLYSIIEGPKRAGCANIALDKLVTGKAIECHFALHDHHELSALQLKWLSLCALPHQQPYMEVSCAPLCGRVAPSLTARTPLSSPARAPLSHPPRPLHTRSPTTSGRRSPSTTCTWATTPSACCTRR